MGNKFIKKSDIEKNRKLLRRKAGIFKVKIEEMEKVLLFQQRAPTSRLGRKIHMIRLFFLPHAQNRYRPHALHPKRIALYAALAIATKSILAITMLAMPFTAWLSTDFYLIQKQELAKRINLYRLDSRVPAMTEDPRLNQAAYIRAADLQKSRELRKASSRGISSTLKIVGYDFVQADEAVAEDFFENKSLYQGWLEDTRMANMLKNGDLSAYGLEIVYDYRTDSNFLVLIMAQPSAANSSLLPAEKSAAKFSAGCPKAYGAATGDGSAAESEIRQINIRPTILGLDEKTLTTENDFKLEISAPDAERVMLYIDERELMLASIPAGNGQNPCLNGYNLEIKLAEGQHSLMVKSIIGRNELYSINYSITVDNTPPYYDSAFSSFGISEPDRERRCLDASVHLSTDTESADLLLGNYKLPMERSAENQNMWSGKLTFAKDAEGLFKKLYGSAVLRAEDKAGNAITQKLEIQDNIFSGAKAASSYLMLKSLKPAPLRAIFKSSNIILEALLTISLILMVLNIYIESHKQKVQVIFSSLGIIGLLLLLMII